MPDLETLRRGVRDWCATHVPKDWREQQRGVSHEELVAFLRWWGGCLRDAGLFAPHWPREWGGGYSIPEQIVIAEVCSPNHDIFFPDAAFAVEDGNLFAKATVFYLG